ncbi:hypothetical protein WBG78_13595 [Chryseolinea sp. T2]|uniref:hypothetical protein n=1 Tax=Chryseolinea sp. T2 TaxID=3129255 RepID=UPI0030783F25
MRQSAFDAMQELVEFNDQYQGIKFVGCLTNQQSDRMAKKETSTEKARDKMRPDEGHGSKGSFGNDGDFNKASDDDKKAKRKASIVTIKEAK